MNGYSSADWMRAFEDAAAEGARIGALLAPERTTVEYRLWWVRSGTKRDLMGRWRADQRYYHGEREGSGYETAQRTMANCRATWPDNRFVMEEARVMIRENEEKLT